MRSAFCTLLCAFTLSACSAAPGMPTSPHGTALRHVADAKAGSPVAVNTLTTIISDMTLPHQAKPHGVPDDTGWAVKPRVGMGNDPKSFRAMTAWGQLYEAAEGNPSQNTRVQIRDLETYILSKRDGRWHLTQWGREVEGAAYREDFARDENKPADVRHEPDGSISVKAGRGYNFHFWPHGRVPIDPGDIAGVLTTVQARLIPDTPRLPDDRDRARYVLGAGGDYWSNVSAGWDNFKTNADIGIGRFKFVTVQWQAFNMTTLDARRLRLNPPPLH